MPSNGRTQTRRRPTNPQARQVAQEHRQVQQRVAALEKTVTPTEPVVRKPVMPSFNMGPVQPVGIRPIKSLFYGPFGHGKTTLAGTALDEPSMQDVLFIAAEPGEMSLTSRRSLDVIHINKYDQVARIFEYLMLHCKWRDEGNIEKLLEYEKQLKANIVPLVDQTAPAEEGRTWFEEQRLRTGRAMDEPFMYRTVIIDNISELHKYLVYKFTGVDIGKTKLDEDIERMEEWQEAQELFRLFIRSFRDLPGMNVLFVAQEAIEPAERNKKRNPHAGQALPALAGQMAGAVAGFLDIVGYLVREIEPGGETHRYLYLGAGYEGWISKHRFENLPDLEYLIDPTMTSLLDLSRKDAQNGTSAARPAAPVQSVAPSGNTAGSAATQRRAGSPPAAVKRAGSSGGARGRDHAVRRR